MWHVTRSWKQIKNCHTSNQGQCHAMYNICITKNMDRFCNSALTYPIHVQPAVRGNKSYSQFYTNGHGSAANQYTPAPRYNQTTRPEQVPLDWNIPFLPELASSRSVDPQSHLQDISSALPSQTIRAYHNGSRALTGADSLFCTSSAGGFLTLNHPLTNQGDFSRVRVFLHALNYSCSLLRTFWVALRLIIQRK